MWKRIVNNHPAFAVIIGTLAFTGTAVADAVYKSVDADGNVTYSANPPPEAVETQSIALPEEPSAAQRQEAEQRARQLEQAAGNAQKKLKRAQPGRGNTVEKAEKELEKAREALEQAKVQKPTDWQNIQGGRFLKPSYLQRVKNAEERVQKAEKKLAEARRDVR